MGALAPCSHGRALATRTQAELCWITAVSLSKGWHGDQPVRAPPRGRPCSLQPFVLGDTFPGGAVLDHRRFPEQGLAPGPARTGASPWAPMLPEATIHSGYEYWKYSSLIVMSTIIHRIVSDMRYRYRSRTLWRATLASRLDLNTPRMAHRTLSQLRSLPASPPKFGAGVERSPATEKCRQSHGVKNPPRREGFWRYLSSSQRRWASSRWTVRSISPGSTNSSECPTRQTH